MLHFVGWEKEAVMTLYSNHALFKMSALLSDSIYVMIAIWLFLIYKNKRDEFPLHLAGFASVFLLVAAIKKLTSIPRPYEVYGLSSAAFHLGSSFPSRHAALSFFMFVTLVLSFRDSKQGKLKRVIVPLFFLWSVLISFSRWILLLHYLQDIIVGWMIGAAVPLLFWVVWQEKVSSEVVRKSIHVVVGYGVALAAWKHGSTIAPALALLTLASLLAMFLLKEKLIPASILKLVSKAERKEDLESFPLRGVVFFFLSSTFVSLIFAREIAAAGIAALAVGDGMATLIGRRWGRIRLRHNKMKTMEGTLSCMVFSTLASLPMVGIYLSIINGVMASVVESLPHREHTKLSMLLDDNFTIPLTCCFTLYLTKSFITG